MRAELQTRTLLGPADPARGAPAPPRRLSATDLIALAEASVGSTTKAAAKASAAAPAQPVIKAAAWGRTGPPRLRPRLGRRLVLAGVVTAVAVAGVALARPSHPDGAGVGSAGPAAAAGPVVAPVAYQLDANAPAAGRYLRALAAQLTAAPYDGSTGRYAYHRSRTWGDPILTAADGRHVLGYASDYQSWDLADGSGTYRRTPLPPQFPDEESREYWLSRLPAVPRPDSGENQASPDVVPLPADRAGIADLLAVRYGAVSVFKEVLRVYERYVVPKATRALLLTVLADVPGFRWRGEVRDRVGRRGVGVTYDDRAHHEQSLLIFDPRTGGLLGWEIVTPQPRRVVNTYSVLLATSRTDQPG
jgi:hypothetical protein